MSDSDILISGDSHVFEPPELWVERGDKDFGDRLPRVVSEENEDFWYFDGQRAVACRISASTGDRFDENAKRRQSRAGDARVGGYDPDERLKDLELDGVYGEVLYPTVGMFAFRWMRSSALFDATCRAYNDWLAEFCASYPDRFKGSAMLNVDDVDVAVTEVERVVKLGLASVMMPVDPGEGRSYDDPAFDRLWAALQDANLSMSFHMLTNRERVVGTHSSLFGGPANTVTQSYYITRAFAQLILGGVFERFPRLCAVSVEFEAGWAGAFINHLDRSYRMLLDGVKHPEWTRFKDGATPRDFWNRNIFMTWQEDDFALRTRHEIGVSRLLWGSDYPHGSGTFPNSHKILDENFQGIPQDERNRIVRDNTAELYGFDLSKARVPASV